MIEEYVYLIGVYFCSDDLRIIGIYTNVRKLLEVYEKLTDKDERCTHSKYPHKPTIYKIPINQFLGEDVPGKNHDQKKALFAGYNNIKTITIEEIKSHILLTSFYGINVFCDLNFLSGPYINLEYVGGQENDYGWIRMNIEEGTVTGAPEYMEHVLQDWYKDNRKYLMEIYRTGGLVEIPEW